MRQSREPTPRQVLQEPDMTENVVSFVPGEGNRPLGIFMDKESEFPSFATINKLTSVFYAPVLLLVCIV